MGVRNHPNEVGSRWRGLRAAGRFCCWRFVLPAARTGGN